jgi:transcriptional regulator with XRE-family HTH domain
MISGDELRKHREARGWSQADLAKKIGYGELSGVRQIQRWESGKTKRPRTEQYYEAVRILTGVEQVNLADIDERLRHVEALLEEVCHPWPAHRAFTRRVKKRRSGAPRIGSSAAERCR